MPSLKIGSSQNQQPPHPRTARGEARPGKGPRKPKELSKTQYMLQSMKQNLEKLPEKGQIKKLPATKQLYDGENTYKYKQQPTDLDRRSSLEQVQSFITNLIHKSEEGELTSTQKFMLAGFIDVFIRQNYPPNETRDNSTVTIEKLKTEWARLAKIWELYLIKHRKCKQGTQNSEQVQNSAKTFQEIYDKLMKMDKGQDQLEVLKKLMRRFYNQLVL